MAGRRSATAFCLALLTCVPLAVHVRSQTADGSYSRSLSIWLEPHPLDPAVTRRLFTAYDSGHYDEFDRLVAPLAQAFSNPFEFEADADAWMAGSPDRDRRGLVAAAVALELASLQRGAHPWNLELAELGCALLRDRPPAPAERAWHDAMIGLSRVTFTVARMGRPPASTDDRQSGEAALHRRQYDAVVERLRRAASRTSASSRLTALTPYPFHARHFAERFPDDPLWHLLSAVGLELGRASLTDTLFPTAPPEWLAPEEVDRIVTAGRRQVAAVPTSRRMDRPSAEKLLAVRPEPPPDPHDWLNGRTPGAAATSLQLWEIADAFERLVDRDGIAAEANIRLGMTFLQLARPERALEAFARTRTLTATPYEMHLAHLLSGVAFDRLGKRAAAIEAFRGALGAVPRAQSAAFALAPLLFDAGERDDAAQILESAVATPLAADPLAFYFRGDPDAAARALGRLREALK